MLPVGLKPGECLCRHTRLRRGDGGIVGRLALVRGRGFAARPSFLVGQCDGVGRNHFTCERLGSDGDRGYVDRVQVVRGVGDHLHRVPALRWMGGGERRKLHYVQCLCVGSNGGADGDDVRLHACAPVWVDASGAYPCGRFLCSEGQKPFREGIRVLKVRVESPLGRCGSAVGSVDDEIEEVGRRQGDRLVGGLVENK